MRPSQLQLGRERIFPEFFVLSSSGRPVRRLRGHAPLDRDDGRRERRDGENEPEGVAPSSRYCSTTRRKILSKSDPSEARVRPPLDKNCSGGLFLLRTPHSRSRSVIGGWKVSKLSRAESTVKPSHARTSSGPTTRIFPADSIYVCETEMPSCCTLPASAQLAATFGEIAPARPVATFLLLLLLEKQQQTTSEFYVPSFLRVG